MECLIPGSPHLPCLPPAAHPAARSALLCPVPYWPAGHAQRQPASSGSERTSGSHGALAPLRQGLLLCGKALEVLWGRGLITDLPPSC